MVKVVAPLFSLNASGTIADTATFSSWKGRLYVRERVIPSNPRTPLQTGMRAMMSFLSKAWDAIPEQTKYLWQQPAKTENVSPFNAYTSQNLVNWRQGYVPAQMPDPPRTAPYPATPTVTAQGGYRIATIDIAHPTGQLPWAYIIYRGTVANFTPAIDNCVAVIAKQPEETIYTDRGLAPGTYYYRVKAVRDNGAESDASAPAQVVVT